MDGKGLALLEERLIASKATAAPQFDPTIVIMIITALLPLIQDCFKPKPATLRRRFLNRARVVTSLRRHAGMSWAEAWVEANNLFDLADAASDADLQLLIDDCCGAAEATPPEPPTTG